MVPPPRWVRAVRALVGSRTGSLSRMTLGDSIGPRVDLDRVWLAESRPLLSDVFWRAQGFLAAPAPVLQGTWDPTSIQLAPRVGRYFENLHHGLLGSSHAIVASHRTLGVRGRTLGELDILYAAPDGAIVHREIAVKFYLGLEGRTEHHCWLGPHKRDRLDLKLARLIQHQLRLPSLAQAAGVWPADLPFPERSEVLLCGAFFVHPRAEVCPEGADPGVELGFWCYASELASLGDAWACLPKPWWLSPKQVDFEPWTSADAVARRVEAERRPAFVGDHGRRGFVVPSGWWVDADAAPRGPSTAVVGPGNADGVLPSASQLQAGCCRKPSSTSVAAWAAGSRLALRTRSTQRVVVHPIHANRDSDRCELDVFAGASFDELPALALVLAIDLDAGLVLGDQDVLAQAGDAAVVGGLAAAVVGGETGGSDPYPNVGREHPTRLVGQGSSLANAIARAPCSGEPPAMA